MKLHFKVDHSPRRRAEYLPLADQLDAAMKGFAALIDGGVKLPQETVDWVEHCRAVKAKHPKPT